MKGTLKDFYTRENRHMAGYKQALQSCSCPALPGMSEYSPAYIVWLRLIHDTVLFIREVARGCGSGPYDQHPNIPGSRLINLKRYRPITWAVRGLFRTEWPSTGIDHSLQRWRNVTRHLKSSVLIISVTGWNMFCQNT